MTRKKKYEATYRLLLQRLPKYEQDLLIEAGACMAACGWLHDDHHGSLTLAYQYCDNASWMLWLIEEMHQRKLVGVLPPWSDLPNELRASVPSYVIEEGLAKWRVEWDNKRKLTKAKARKR